jgi:hypothetical protein
MQQAVDALPFRGIEDGLDCPGNAGLFSEACEPTLREGVQRITNRLDTTADLLGNRCWGLLPGAGQDNLAAAQSQRMLGAQTAFEVTAFIIGQGANKHRWFPGRQDDTGMSFCTRPLFSLH